MDETKNRVLNLFIYQEDDMYVAECVDIGTVSQGKTVDEAVQNIIEATELYLEELPKDKIMEFPRIRSAFLSTIQLANA